MRLKNKSQIQQIFLITFVSIFLLACNSGSNSSESDAPKDNLNEKAMETTADFQISLAQWSLHKTYFGGSIENWQEFGRMLMESPDELLQGDLDPMDFHRWPQATALTQSN